MGCLAGYLAICAVGRKVGSVVTVTAGLLRLQNLPCPHLQPALGTMVPSCPDRPGNDSVYLKFIEPHDGAGGMFSVTNVHFCTELRAASSRCAPVSAPGLAFPQD